MRKLGHALRLGVGVDSLALVETRRWGREASLLAELPLDTALALPAAIAAGAAQLFDTAKRDRSPLTVVLADELARLWQVTPPAGCSRMADLEAAAALRFQQLYGEPAASWQLSANWQLGAPFLAAALPRSLLAALQQASHAHAMRLVEVVPQFIALCNRWHARVDHGDWFGVAHDGVLSLGVCERGAISTLRAIAIGAQANSGWLVDHLAREALRLGMAAPQRLRLCGAVPPAWLSVPGCVRLDQQVQAHERGLSAAALLALSGSAA